MRALSHKALVALALCGALSACFVPDYRRECRENRDCREGQVCRFSNCVVPAATPEANNGEALECRPEQIDCDGRCITCAQEPNAALNGCRNGGCAYRCEGEARDLNQNLGLGFDGCECVPDGDEVCDGRDNDCDGAIDEGAPLALCPARPNTNTVGCDGGVCKFTCGPSTRDLNGDLSRGLLSDGCECFIEPRERCDGIDNDCDNQIDENAAVDDCPAVQNASPTACNLGQGTCRYVCEAGTVDVNGDLALRERGDGCECVESLCDNQEGVCEGALRFCSLPQDQECPGEIFAGFAASAGKVWEGGEETRCDGEDNNCDGAVDELCCGFGQATARDLLPNNGEVSADALVVAWSPDLRYYAVTFRDEDTGYLYAAVISQTGQPIGPLHVLSNSAGLDGATPRWQGDHFEIFWVEDNLLRRGDLSTLGQINTFFPPLPPPEGVELENNFQGPVVTRGEDQTLYVVAGDPDDDNVELLRLHPNGATLGRAPLEATIPFVVLQRLKTFEDQIFITGSSLLFAPDDTATGQSALFSLDTSRGDLRGLQRWEGASLPVTTLHHTLEVDAARVRLLRQRPAFQGSNSRVEVLSFNRALTPDPNPTRVILTLQDPALALAGSLWASGEPDRLLFTHITQGGLLWWRGQASPAVVWPERDELEELSLAPHALGSALFGLVPDAFGRERPVMRVLGPENDPLCP
jgi:hypothetical protein